MKKYRRAVIKVGTNVLTRADGGLDLTAVSRLVDQLAQLKAQGTELILVSSGAVGAGRSLHPDPRGLSKVVRRQVLSAIGQVRLMEIYRQLLANYGLLCAQVLATKEDFRDRVHYTHMQNCLLALLRNAVIPILNENDVVAVSELMFTDNDELAGLVAAMINAEALVLLSSVDGLLDGPPGEPESRVIAVVEPDSAAAKQHILPTRSSFGRGGMLTKFRIAQKSANLGIDTYLANGKRENILLDLWRGEGVCTHFRAGEPLSNVKKWMAHHGPEAGKASVFINSGAAAALTDLKRVSSLLPIGVVRLEGDFQKGDLLRILTEEGRPVGLGIAQYGALTARQYLGQRGKRALVHYDYLLVENG